MNPGTATDEVMAKFAGARLWACHQAPYLANAIFALTPALLEPGTDPDTGAWVPDPGLAAFPANTNWVVHIDPATVLANPVERTGWWLLHQVGHLVRGHAARSPVRPAPGATGPTHAMGLEGQRDSAAHRWNQAADAEINDDLETEGLTGPDGVISPRELGLPGNRMAEEYLSLLDVLDDALVRGGTSLSDAVDCGSAADGIERPWDRAGGAGLSELEREMLERSLAAGIQERASARSDVPGGWVRWAEARLRPQIDWRAQVGSLIRKGLTETSGRVDFSYRRPSRRAAAYGDFVTPAMTRPVPETALVLDTSGSVTAPVLERLVGEVTGIIDKVSGPGRRLRVLCCDTKAHPVQEIRKAAELRLVGGGGTDMRAYIEAAMELRPAPDLVLVMTDGQTPWPERRPPAKVLVCLIGDDGRAPDWAARVRIPADVEEKER